MVRAQRRRLGIWSGGMLLLTGACQAILDEDYSFPSSDEVTSRLGGAGASPGSDAGGLGEADCPDGLHACDGQCVDSASVDTCGTRCSPCPVPEGGASACVAGECSAECPAGLQPCGANCIAEGSACDGQCPAEQHDCGGVCVAQTSTLSCGSSCDACAAPGSGGIATCDGETCGVRCDTEFHECNGQCVPNTDLTSCGARCEPCPAPDNGRATCDGVSCGVVCDVDFHECDGQCVSDASPDSCGDSCQPCPTPEGGSARCEEARFCVPECPADQKLCRTRCIALDAPCDGECPPGTHLCGEFCSPDNDPSSCGARCEPCPPAPDGVATCEAGACSVRCNTNHHDCGGACVSDFDINSCGSSCAACPAAPANGQASCNVTAQGPRCDFTCRSGFHRCGVQCLSDSSTSSCGSSCTACSPPANGRSTCNGTSCGFECNSGFFKCCGACIADGSACRSPCFQIVLPRDPSIQDPVIRLP